MEKYSFTETSFKIQQSERNALYGLPHIQQLVYLIGIRPFMDYYTGIVGIKRRVSYQSLCEALFVEAHPGYKSSQPSRDQIRRAIKGLSKAGLIQIKSDENCLILKCVLAAVNNSAQNKPATKPPYQAATILDAKVSVLARENQDKIKNADTNQNVKPTTPQDINNNYIFLLQKFEKFWAIYPIKKSRAKTEEIFLKLAPDDVLFQKIYLAIENEIKIRREFEARGVWLPNWKYPANWLMQRSWEDEINFKVEKNTDENSRRYSKKQTGVDILWASCRKSIPESLFIDGKAKHD